MIGAITAGLYGTGIPPVTNSYESIATVTVGSGGTSTISFGSIPSTYKHLQIRYLARTTNGYYYDDLNLTINSDSGSNYSRHYVQGDGASATAYGQASQTKINFASTSGASATASSFGAGIIDILDYTNTNKNKTIRVFSGYDTNSTWGVSKLSSGAWLSTSAVSSLTIVGSASTNFLEYSSFALYGIKG